MKTNCAWRLILILAALLPGARAQMVQKWARHYQGGPVLNQSLAAAVAVDAAGDIIVTGRNDSWGTGADYATLKYNGGTGALIWERRYDGPGHKDDIPQCVKVDGNGDVFVTGLSTNAAGDTDFYTAKYAGTDGALIWEQRHDGAGHSHDAAQGLAVDFLGDVVVTGYSFSTGDNLDYYTAKYSGAAPGTLVWEHTYDGPQGLRDTAYGIAVDSVGNVFVTGGSQDSFLGPYDNFDFLTIKYSPGGSVLWTKRTNGPTGTTDVAFALVVDPAGDVIVTGESYDINNFDYDYLTEKYDKTSGATVWTRTYASASGDDIPAAIAVDAGGNVAVTGSATGTMQGASDYYTAKYAAGDGAVLWEMRYDGPFHYSDSASGVVMDAAGNVIVTGACSVLHGSLNTDIGTVSYASADGAVLWETRYNGPENLNDGMAGQLYGSKIALTPGGGVVVVGHSATYLNSYPDSAFTIVKYGPPFHEIEVDSPAGTILVDAVSNVDCGAVSLGSNSPVQTFMVKNLGDENLGSLAVGIDGADVADFVTDFSGVTPILAPGASFTFQVTFHPTTIGAKAAAIHVASNDADENPFDIGLTGMGFVVPDIAINDPDGNDLTFGSSYVYLGAVAVRGNSPPGTFTIRNAGSAALNLGTITRGGADPGEFTLGLTNVDASLAPGESTTITVTFHPTAEGTRYAKLFIPSDDPDETPFEINIYGDGFVNYLSYGDWALAAGLAWPESAEDATPFNDGVANLLKYAFNMDGTRPDTRTLEAGTGTAGLPLWRLVDSDGITVLRVEFLYRKGSGLIYNPMISTTLDPLSFTPMTGEPVSTNIDLEWERITFEQVVDPVTQPQCFGRVEVIHGGTGGEG